MPRLTASSETETNQIGWERKISCGPGRERKESSRCHPQAQARSSDHAAHVGMGLASRNMGETGADGEIIKSTGWNDRMNRNPR